MIPILALDIGGVHFLGKVDDQLFDRRADKIGLTSMQLRQRIWHGPDIQAANDGQISADEYLRKTAVRLDTEPRLVRRMLLDGYFHEVNDELISFTRRLKAQEVRVVALTNNWSWCEELLVEYGIFRSVEHTIEELAAKYDIMYRPPGEAS